MAERKRGALSEGEMTFIREGVDRFSPEEIAKNLNRNVEPIKKYIRLNRLGKQYAYQVDQNIKNEHTILVELKKKAFYKNLSTQLTISEMQFFSEHWVSIFMQFNGDVLASEELELKELLILEILKNREGTAEKERLEMIESINKEIIRERKLPKNQRDNDYIKQMQNEVLTLRTSSATYIKNMKDLCDRAEKMRTALSGSRRLRAEEFKNAKVDFTSWLKWLEEYENKFKVGREMELLRQAKDKELERLAGYHTFVNKEVAQPVLNADTVANED